MLEVSIGKHTKPVHTLFDFPSYFTFFCSAKQFREALSKKHEVDCGLAMIIKQRAKANEIEKMDLVGSVEGCDAIIVDDMVDTAGTLCKAAEILKGFGARRVFAFCSHGVLSGPAATRIANSVLTELVVLDTIPLSDASMVSDMHL
jgi:ribose-phosphate pyrophosphokinase